eukprot:TRINITY_DN4956_c0_g2_i2.p1 TRINITY_DN4956_c0_g2~~TRINITY_DN4956_c0_g2_i2.p1  ORF type:complete len:943 (+),score=297.45 TRINITY_DN4956_c0_g2_i2:113-2830(+)
MTSPGSATKGAKQRRPQRLEPPSPSSPGAASISPDMRRDNTGLSRGSESTIGRRSVRRKSSTAGCEEAAGEQLTGQLLARARSTAGPVVGALALLYVLLSLWRSQSEVERLQQANRELAQLARDAGRAVPSALAQPVSAEASSGIETLCFLMGVLFLTVLSARFLLNEFRKLRTLTIQGACLAEGTDGEPKAVQYEWEVVKEFVFYRLDYWFSTSTYGKPIVLLAITLILILVGGVLNWMVNPNTLGFSLWRAWAYIADSGVHADEHETGARAVALCLTIGGMLVFALVIGLISDGISTKFDELKAGRAKVIETDHTLILGWSDKTIPLIREIALANESVVKDGTGQGVIVVLAEMEKEQMEHEIRTAQSSGALELRGSMVVCRRGNPTVLHCLQHVSAGTARSVVVLSPAGVCADEADARSLRSVMCLVGLRYEKGHVTVEVQDVDNKDLVHIIGGDCVETVVAHDFIGRLIVQSSRQSGLAKILEQILGFEGHEFYMQSHGDALAGRTFGEVLFMFEHAVPLGVRTAEPDLEAVQSGDRLDPYTCLNPPDRYVFQPGDRVIVIAEDDDTYRPAEGMLTSYPPKVTEKLRAHRLKEPPAAERVLIVGWRRDLGDMLRELDEVVGAGSELCLLSTVPLDSREARLNANGRNVQKSLQNLTLRHAEGNPIVRRELERLPIEEFDTIFILADEQYEGDMETADGRSLTSMLLIHDIRRQREHGGEQTSPVGLARSWTRQSSSPSWRTSPRCISFCRTPLEKERHESMRASTASTLVSEVLDPRTRQIIQLAHVSDYVMSNEMVSQALAMVSECREVNAILQEILSSKGNEIFVHDAGEYIDTPLELSFFELMANCRTHGAILIGYAPRGSKSPIINPDGKTGPPKSQKRRWEYHDKLVLLADSEEET